MEGVTMTQDPEREDLPVRLPPAPRPPARIAAVAAGLFLIPFGMACSNKPAGRQVEASANGRPLPVQVAKVELRQVRRTVESVGSLFPYEEVTVSSEVEGKVEEVVADVGDRVNQGQPLVKILPTESCVRRGGSERRQGCGRSQEGRGGPQRCRCEIPASQVASR